MPILDEVRITELPGADPLAGLELIPLVQSGVTKTRSAQNLVLEGGLQDHLDDADPHTQYAGLDGGANANFTTMPQVGGDPIVDSGSNADGEWTRWSDGTQNVRNIIVARTWTYPMAFTTRPAVCATPYNGGPNIIASFSPGPVSGVLETNDTNPPATRTGHSTNVSAMGSWK